MVLPADGFGTSRPTRSFGSVLVERLAPKNRNIGIDTARGIAIVGMIATHVVPLLDDNWQATPVTIFAGRASALFAVLAGISIILSTKRTLDSGTNSWARASVALVTRGLCIMVIGLLVGMFTTHVAVILVNYGFMFVLAPIFLRAGPRTLGVTAALWMLTTPWISHAVRAQYQLDPAYEIPTFLSLADPGHFFIAITLTGYYPVLQWMGYILLGMALGHVNWYRTTACLAALTIGAGVAVLAKVISYVARNSVTCSFELGSLAASHGWAEPEVLMRTGTHGVTPTDSLCWHTMAGPHMGTTLDLLATSGVAVAVIGVSCLISNALGTTGATFEQNPQHELCEGPGRVWLCFLSAPGSMPLTVYSCHVVFLEVTKQFPIGPWPEYALHIYVLIFAALLWKTFVYKRGPLEQVVSIASSRAARLVPGDTRA